MAVVSGDLRIVEDSGETVTLYGSGTIIEDDSENVVFNDTSTTTETQVSAYQPNAFDIDDPYVIIPASSDDTADNEICPNIDTASEWARKEIVQAFGLELIPETMQNHYQSEQKLSEFVKLAVSLYESIMGEIDVQTASTDIKDAEKKKAQAIGLTNSVRRINFKDDKVLTREQAAVMLYNLAIALGTPAERHTARYSDIRDVSRRATGAVGYVQYLDIMVGNEDRFEPKGAFIREQGIVAVFRLYNIIENI